MEIVFAPSAALSGSLGPPTLRGSLSLSLTHSLCLPVHLSPAAGRETPWARVRPVTLGRHPHLPRHHHLPLFIDVFFVFFFLLYFIFSFILLYSILILILLLIIVITYFYSHTAWASILSLKVRRSGNGPVPAALVQPRRIGTIPVPHPDGLTHSVPLRLTTESTDLGLSVSLSVASRLTIVPVLIFLIFLLSICLPSPLSLQSPFPPLSTPYSRPSTSLPFAVVVIASA